MFKKIVVILFLSVLSVRPAFYVGNVVYYQLHINEIVEKYCVNKDKPELQCNGKCHLAQQIKTTVRTEQQDVVAELSIAFYPVYYQSIPKNFITIGRYSEDKDLDSEYVSSYFYLQVSKVDRPPIA